MDELNIMTAKQAKDKATALENKKVRDELLVCKGAIEKAAEEGKLRVNLTSVSIGATAKAHLESLGYRVSTYSGDQRDPEWGLIIEWK